LFLIQQYLIFVNSESSCFAQEPAIKISHRFQTQDIVLITWTLLNKHNGSQIGNYEVLLSNETGGVLQRKLVSGTKVHF